MLAVCAMLLPGISGSYILNILGEYSLIIGALADFTSGLKAGSFDSYSFLLLFNLFIGVLLGALMFSRLLTWLFYQYRSIVVSALIGFMIGSLHCIWPFWAWDYWVPPLKIFGGVRLQLLYPILPDFFSLHFWLAFSLMGLAFLVVMALEFLASKLSLPISPAADVNSIKR